MINRASCVKLNGAVREVGGHRFLLYCHLRGACGSYGPPQRQCALGLQCKPERFLFLRFCPTLLTRGSIYFYELPVLHFAASCAFSFSAI